MGYELPAISYQLRATSFEPECGFTCSSRLVAVWLVAGGWWLVAGGWWHTPRFPGRDDMNGPKIDRRTLLKAGAALAASGGADLLRAQSGFNARPARALPPRGEFVIRGAIVLTMDGKIGDFARGDVHVRNGAIVAVAESINS